MTRMVRIDWSAIHIHCVTVAACFNALLKVVMAVLAQRLERSVEEQIVIDSMWRDMVCDLCCCDPIILQA